MRNIALVWLILLNAHSLFGQVDSFSVNEYTFKFPKINGWTFQSKDNGICEYAETNVRFDMQLKCKKCFGSLMISISEITDSEKKRRSLNPENEDTLKLSEATFEKNYFGYYTLGGFYDARLDDDTFHYSNQQGIYSYSKKELSNRNLSEIHFYTRWSYFPINDSLEILICFQGFIPHNEEEKADAASMQLIDYFFRENGTTLDSMLKNTGSSEKNSNNQSESQKTVRDAFRHEFSFLHQDNPWRKTDIGSLSGDNIRFGYINHDSLLALMPEYLAAKDSVRHHNSGYYETIAAMESEIRQKERQYDSLKSKSTPTMNRLREVQLQQMRENYAAYQALEADSIAACERKYLGPYHDKMNSSSAIAVQQAKCDAMINYQNIPNPDPEKPMEFVNLNAEVAKLLGL